MNDSDDNLDQQRQLWRQYLAQAQPASEDLSALDPNVLAAYLEGSANPGQIEQVESRIARDPALLEELIELRGLGNLELAAVSPSLLARAKALASSESTRRPSPQQVASILYTWRQRLQWTAAAAAVLLACFAGYSIGQVTFRGQQRAETLVVSLDMEELISEPALAISLPLNGQNGR